MATFEDMSPSTWKQSKLGDARAKFTDDVPREVRRFIWCTSPHKCWAEYLAGNWYRSMQLMRKYDGWFVVVYVDHEKKVRWQTTSGFVHSVLIAELQPLLAHMEELVEAEKLKPTHAFKLEIVVANIDNEDFLHMVGKKLDHEHFYKLIVTDCFTPYSEAMIKDLNERLQAQRQSALKHKTAPLSAQGWLDSFRANQGHITARLQNALELLLDANIPHLEIADSRNLDSPNVKISGRGMVLDISRSLTQSAVEGCIVHCTDKRGKHVIYKVKLEYMGGLGSYYSPTLDEEIRQCNTRLQDPKEMHAGRQFVVRCVTVECFHGTHIPINIGVGYYDDHLCAWVVSDCIKVKYSGGARLGRYIDTTEQVDGKHIGITRQTQHIANMIAKILDIANPTPDVSNLHQTSHFKKESTRNLLNVAELGLVVGGNANHVYKSESGNYHLQAAVLKCIGINASSHAFTDAEIEDVRAFATHAPVINGIIEWSKGDWERMTELNEHFNKSHMLTTDTSECMLWQRLQAIRAMGPHVPRPIFSKLQNLRGIRCCCFGPYGKVAAIVRRIFGECVYLSDVGNIDEHTDIKEQIDIVFIPEKANQFSNEKFESIKQKIKIPFLTVRCSWALKCEKDRFQMPDITQYTVEYGPLLPDDTFIEDEQRFLWKRANHRLHQAVEQQPLQAVEQQPQQAVEQQPQQAVEQPPERPPAENLPDAAVGQPPAENLPDEAIGQRPATPLSLEESQAYESDNNKEGARVRPPTPPQLSFKLRRPVSRINYSFHKIPDPKRTETAHFSRTIRYYDNLIFDLGGTTFDFGGVCVITEYPFFENEIPTFSMCIHANYFHVLKLLRDKFSEWILDEGNTNALDYKQEEWKQFFVFVWNGTCYTTKNWDTTRNIEDINIENNIRMESHVKHHAQKVLRDKFNIAGISLDDCFFAVT